MVLIARSPLFDSRWYLLQNPDVELVSANPLVHYARRGGVERRDPSPLFHTKWYVQHNPAAARMNPLVHYLRYGRPQGQRPDPRFHGKLPEPRTTVAVVSALIIAVASVILRMSREGGWRARIFPAPERATNRVASWRSRPRIIFISGEPRIAGHMYRVANVADSLAPRFFETLIISVEELPRRWREAANADVLWIWRATWSKTLAHTLAVARRNGARVVFDVDDLMFRPEIAREELIDGIRSQGFCEKDVANHYKLVRMLISHADHCTAPTVTLARELRACFKPTTVIPNGFGRRTFELSRAASLQKSHAPGDGLIRIGYAAGTLTHQRDFALAANAIATVLAENTNVRLVVFRGTIELSEFPELQRYSGQIEWRDFVPVAELPAEYARFDINLAPLEVGNCFCEAKSELKYFEAALVGVPTVASPTEPFARAIRHGETGLLAETDGQWLACLRDLVASQQLRARLAEQAYREVLWLYGPERRSQLVTELLSSLLTPLPVRAELAQLSMDQRAAMPMPLDVPEYEVVYKSERRASSRVAVIIPLYNYGHFLEECLDSVLRQDCRNIDVVVVDDASTDASLAIACLWLEAHAADFNQVALLRNVVNSGLGPTRNAGVSFTEAELFLPVDADNLLLPNCISACLAELDSTGAAFAYPTLEMFGDRTGLFCNSDYNPFLFQSGNYVDAMALVRKACWLAVGGYADMRPAGWEDYDFWCKLAEKGFFGVHVPAVLGKYRVHGSSMLATITELPHNKSAVIRNLNTRHPWLELRLPDRFTGVAVHGDGNDSEEILIEIDGEEASERHDAAAVSP